MTIEQLLAGAIKVWEPIGLKYNDVKESNDVLLKELEHIHEIDNENLREVLSILSKDEEDAIRRAENILNSVLILKGLRDVRFVGVELFSPRYGLNEEDKELLREVLDVYTSVWEGSSQLQSSYKLENLMQLALLSEISSSSSCHVNIKGNNTMNDKSHIKINEDAMKKLAKEVVTLVKDSNMFLNNYLIGEFTRCMKFKSIRHNEDVKEILIRVIECQSNESKLIEVLYEVINTTGLLDDSLSIEDCFWKTSSGATQEFIHYALARSNVVYNSTKSIFMTNSILGYIRGDVSNPIYSTRDSLIASIMCVVLRYVKMKEEESLDRMGMSRLYEFESQDDAESLNDDMESEVSAFVSGLTKVDKSVVTTTIKRTIESISALPMKSFMDKSMLDSFFEYLNQSGPIDSSIMYYLLNSLAHGYDNSINLYSRCSYLYEALNVAVAIPDYELNHGFFYCTSVERFINRSGILSDSKLSDNNKRELINCLNTYTRRITNRAPKKALTELTVDALVVLLILCIEWMIGNKIKELGIVSKETVSSLFSAYVSEQSMSTLKKDLAAILLESEEPPMKELRPLLLYKLTDEVLELTEVSKAIFALSKSTDLLYGIDSDLQRNESYLVECCSRLGKSIEELVGKLGYLTSDDRPVNETYMEGILVISNDRNTLSKLHISAERRESIIEDTFAFFDLGVSTNVSISTIETLNIMLMCLLVDYAIGLEKERKINKINPIGALKEETNQ